MSCPGCSDPIDPTDSTLSPCRCGYQMCRYCWGQNSEQNNNICPGCNSVLRVDYFKFSTNESSTTRYSFQKKAREREKKLDLSSRKQLTNMRVVQRNLVYVTNLALCAAKEEVLRSSDYFGKFGPITKTIINRNSVYSGPQGQSVSAYVTYQNNKDAFAAIKALDGALKDGRSLRASFGTTKYCTYFLRNTRCPNPECMYLHDLGKDLDSFTKQDMAQGKHLLALNSEESSDQKSDSTEPLFKLRAWNTVITEIPVIPKPSDNPPDWNASPRKRVAQLKLERKIPTADEEFAMNRTKNQEASPTKSGESTSEPQRDPGIGIIHDTFMNFILLLQSAFQYQDLNEWVKLLKLDELLGPNFISESKEAKAVIKPVCKSKSRFRFAQEQSLNYSDR